MKVLTVRTIVLFVVGMAFHFQAAAQQTYKNVTRRRRLRLMPYTFLLLKIKVDVFRLYRNDASGSVPFKIFDFASQLHPGSDGESDIEGAARIGDRVYWITLYGRDAMIISSETCWMRRIGKAPMRGKRGI